MKTIHVCLMSDQAIPNILSVHHFRPDELLLVSTPVMEKREKSRHILAALASVGVDYEGRHSIIEVPEDSIQETHRRLDAWMSGQQEAADYILNLTGGTKMMSIAAYEFFKDYGARMIYIPLGRNEFITPFPKKHTGSPEPLALRLPVAGYLAAYGLKVVNARGLQKGKSDAAARRELSAWIVANYEKIKPLLERLGEKLRKHRDNRDGFMLNIAYTPGMEEKELLDRMDFVQDGDHIAKHLDKSEIGFVTGGWLEEFCYNQVAALIGKGIDDAVIGVKIMNSNKRDNEFDVMFTRGNALYTVECKSLDQHDDPRADALYKIAALQKEFGLRVESFFVSTSPHIMRDGVLKPSIQARAEQFRTTVVSPKDVAAFGAKLKEKLEII
jgi:hypothetical protein